jgi:hypothetical protein
MQTVLIEFKRYKDSVEAEERIQELIVVIEKSSNNIEFFEAIH